MHKKGRGVRPCGLREPPLRGEFGFRDADVPGEQPVLISDRDAHLALHQTFLAVPDAQSTCHYVSEAEGLHQFVYGFEVFVYRVEAGELVLLLLFRFVRKKECCFTHRDFLDVCQEADYVSAAFGDEAVPQSFRRCDNDVAASALVTRRARCPVLPVLRCEFEVRVCYLRDVVFGRYGLEVEVHRFLLYKDRACV